MNEPLRSVYRLVTNRALASAHTRDWACPSTAARAARDERVDFLRGLAIISVIVNHIAIRSGFHIFTHEGAGIFTGAEFFVLLSGFVVGLVYLPRGQEHGLGQVTARLTRRSAQLYSVAFVLGLAMLVLTLLPAVNLQPLVLDDDAVQPMHVCSMADGLLSLATSLALLKCAPFQVDILGLYVVLMLATPVMLRAVIASKSVWLLAISVGAYLLHLAWPLKILPLPSEDPFPLLAWQALFVIGLLGACHRDRITAFFVTSVGKACFACVTTIALACLAFAWNNPAHSLPGHLRLTWLHPTTFNALYHSFFLRPQLGPGRLINVLSVFVLAYAALTRFWIVVKGALGWLLIPLGAATLYAYIVHVVFVLSLGNTPLAQLDIVTLNTAIHSGVILLIWFMIRRKVLFRWIPR